jgi:hypothetical protein
MPFKKGTSGNPHGRPVANRALTEILKVAGDDEVMTLDGPVQAKELAARLLWQMATTGQVRFPDGRVLQASTMREWLDAVSWMYRHVDGTISAGAVVTVDNRQQKVIVVRGDEAAAQLMKGGEDGEEV